MRGYRCLACRFSRKPCKDSIRFFPLRKCQGVFPSARLQSAHPVRKTPPYLRPVFSRFPTVRFAKSSKCFERSKPRRCSPSECPSENGSCIGGVEFFSPGGGVRGIQQRQQTDR